MGNVLTCQSADAIESLRQQRWTIYRIVRVAGNYVNRVFFQEHLGHPLRSNAPVSSQGICGDLNETSILCKLDHFLRRFQ